MGQFEKETCGSVSAPGKAPKSDTAKWHTDPPRRVGRRFRKQNGVADRSSPEGRQAVLKTEKGWQTDWVALDCRSRGSPAEARTKPPSIPYGTFAR